MSLLNLGLVQFCGEVQVSPCSSRLSWEENVSFGIDMTIGIDHDMT